MSPFPIVHASDEIHTKIEKGHALSTTRSLITYSATDVYQRMHCRAAKGKAKTLDLA